MRGEFLPKAELERLLGEIATAMVQVVRVSKLDRESQDDLLRQVLASRGP